MKNKSGYLDSGNKKDKLTNRKTKIENKKSMGFSDDNSIWLKPKKDKQELLENSNNKECDVNYEDNSYLNEEIINEGDRQRTEDKHNNNGFSNKNPLSVGKITKV